MSKIESRPDMPIVDRMAWLTRSVQGHLLAHWWCGQHWHRNGWLIDDDGLRCAPRCTSPTGSIRLHILGDATVSILRDIDMARAPAWRQGTLWSQRLIQEELARLTPSAPRRQSVRQQARKPAPRIRVRTPIRPRRSTVPARTWRAASEGIVVSWSAYLAGRGVTVDKRMVSRLQRESHRLLERIQRDPVAAWRQLVDETGGDLNAAIVAAMR
jgi:hypothetical protein